MHDQIIQSLRSNAVDDAIATAREWIARQPEDAQAHRWLAVALQQGGNAQGAMQSLDRAIELAPEDASLQMVRASLLVAARQVEQAQAALATATGLDPNQFGAYLMQAQLALGRGDLDEAERQNRLAARVEPEHPQLAVIDSMVALQRGRPDLALKLIAAGLQKDPEDLQLRFASGFVYMGNGHWAFAEQAFRSVAGQLPQAGNLRPLISELANRQGRPADAAEELAPLLEDPETTTPVLLRLSGMLRLEAGQAEAALPLLRRALAAMPGDRRTLQALLRAWRELGRIEEARSTLDAALATTTDAPELWRARLWLEKDPDALRELVERWTRAMPESVLPLETMLSLQQQTGDGAGAEATVQRILALQPAHAAARLQVLDGLMEQDPAQAVAQIDTWLADAADPTERRFLLGLKGVSHDQAGRSDDAVQAWTLMQEAIAPTRVPLPPLSPPRSDWPELAERPDPAHLVMFLWGAPGSGVERVASVLQAETTLFRGDRLGPNPPQDGFQAFAVIEALASGSVEGAQVVERWRAALPSRGVPEGNVFDWLPWWDNALLIALRPHLREAMLLLVVRDPRDMLLEWLAFGSSLPFVFPSPLEAARWLAGTLNQVATLHEMQWFPTRVVHTDSIGHDPKVAAELVNQALQSQIPVPASVGPQYFPAGHWRHYAQALAEPFAVLAPVAARLGYPAD